MPVTFKVASHKASPYAPDQVGIAGAEDVLKRACRHQAKQCKELLQTSLTAGELSSSIPAENGFVDTVIIAYNQHHALIIR
jgi:hypothetical protein